MTHLLGARKNRSAEAPSEPDAGQDVRLRHDIRQSLATLRALVSLVESDPQLSADANQRLSLAHHEVDWITELLAAYDEHGDQTPLQVVDVGEVVSQAWTSVAMSADCQVRLFREPMVYALTDAVTLRRSARNLIENAVRAAGRNGRVEIHVRADRDDAVVEVTDDGPGFGRIPAQQGLGLVTVRRFVARFGGSLDVGSSRLGGARVLLTVPTHLQGLIEQRTPA